MATDIMATFTTELTLYYSLIRLVGAVLGLVALWFRECRDRVEGSNGESSDVAALKDSLMRLPISFGMANNTREQCKKIAARLVGKEVSERRRRRRRRRGGLRKTRIQATNKLTFYYSS